MIRIAFLATAQAHQFLHFIPAALELAAREGVTVDVFSASQAGLEFIRGYDPEGRLRLNLMKTPSWRRDGLFSTPSRRLALELHWRKLRGFDAVVTTETSSSVLRSGRRLDSPMIEIKHGAGDRAGGYKNAHSAFDLVLVAGDKDRERMIALGIAEADRVKVAGYAKFEAPSPPVRPFDDAKPWALYNPHFDRAVSSWHRHGRAFVAAVAAIPEWNFLVAPHVKLTHGRSLGPPPAANIRIDPGSARSIDMSYSRAADVYIGDASSQAYEYIREPRPCIFLNLDHRDWRGDPSFAHWEFGQVIEELAELRPALERAAAVQTHYAPIQQAALARSIDQSAMPASVRQADAILTFINARASAA
ncbi:MAG: glycosyl transferase [Sphingomicrobium sp.]